MVSFSKENAINMFRLSSQSLKNKTPDIQIRRLQTKEPVKECVQGINNPVLLFTMFILGAKHILRR